VPASGAAMAGATIANELALRDRPAIASRYGPTDLTLIPPTCDAPLAAGATAELTLDLAGTMDGGSLGVARVRGERSGRDFRWLAEVTTTRDIGLFGAAVAGSQAWIRQSDTRWVPAPREGARARHCRVAVDGASFRGAFPQVRWLVGATDLADWRGEIDVWVFADGQLGRAEGRLGGPGFAISPGAIRVDLTATLTAIHRGDPVTITPPTN
jgi:hypothetical protein